MISDSASLAPGQAQHPDLLELRQNIGYNHFFVDSHQSIPPRMIPYAPLDNYILPVWRYHAFRNFEYGRVLSASDYDDPQWDIGTQLYLRLKPALRLATLFYHRSIHLFVRMLRCPCPNSDISLGGRPTFDPSWRPTAEDFHHLTKAMQRLSLEHRVLALPEQPPNDTHIAGKNGRVIDPDSVTDPSIQAYNILSALCIEDLDEYFQDDMYLKKTQIQIASMHLQTAITLVHELAHAVVRMRHNLNGSVRQNVWGGFVDSGEPSVYPENFNEIGHALVRFLLGFEVDWPYGAYRTRGDILAGLPFHPMRRIHDGSFGITARFQTEPNSDDSIVMHIASETIYAFFNKSEWNGGPISMYFIPLLMSTNSEINPQTLKSILPPVQPLLIQASRGQVELQREGQVRDPNSHDHQHPQQPDPFQQYQEQIAFLQKQQQHHLRKAQQYQQNPQNQQQQQQIQQELLQQLHQQHKLLQQLQARQDRQLHDPNSLLARQISFLQQHQNVRLLQHQRLLKVQQLQQQQEHQQHQHGQTQPPWV